MKNNNGYTLIEMMIVLSIISVVTTIVIVSFNSLYKAYETDQFFEQFENDLYYAQQLAINNGKITYMVFDTLNHSYGIKQQNQILYKRSYSKNIRIQENSIRPDEISFNANGNISKGGSIIIRINNVPYYLVFTLGKGRFYIAK